MASAAMTDEQIEYIVAMVQAAETLGTALGLSAADGVRFMLKSQQAMVRITEGQGAAVLLTMPSKTKA